MKDAKEEKGISRVRFVGARGEERKHRVEGSSKVKQKERDRDIGEGGRGADRQWRDRSTPRDGGMDREGGQETEKQKWGWQRAGANKSERGQM